MLAAPVGCTKLHSSMKSRAQGEKGICHMKCLAKGQERVQAASSQVPLVKRGDGFEWSVD